MQFFRKYSGVFLLCLSAIFLGWVFVFRPEPNSLSVSDQPNTDTVRIDNLFISAGSYVTVTRLDRYGRNSGVKDAFSEYLLPGQYQDLYIKISEPQLDIIENSQGLLIEVYKETHHSPTNELYYGEEDVVAKDMLGRPLRKKIIFN